MSSKSDKNIMFFGCPMDCDEKYDSIQDKLNKTWTAQGYDDPFDGVMEHLSSDLPEDTWKNLNSLPIPAWLGPKPDSKEQSSINTENFISFIDSNGCKKFADQADEFVTKNILPDIPCLIG
ncbi:MAG: hypothetical protein GY857_02715, partial [Desulfobacula sp.]|nr:hypothetical protein [Desulfobacula sp.]